MRYLKYQSPSDWGTDIPQIMWYEINAKGYEHRKIGFYHGGRYGFISRYLATNDMEFAGGYIFESLEDLQTGNPDSDGIWTASTRKEFRHTWQQAWRQAHQRKAITLWRVRRYLINRYARSGKTMPPEGKYGLIPVQTGSNESPINNAE